MKMNPDIMETAACEKLPTADTSDPFKPRKKRVKKTAMDVDMDLIQAEPASSVVIPFFSMISENALSTDFVHSFRGIGFSAIVDPSNEQNAFKQLRYQKKTFEDTQLVSPVLPVDTPLEFADAPSSVVGGLLTFCRLVDVVQNLDKTTRDKQYLSNFDFTLIAVSVNGCKTGAFAALLHLLITQLHEFLPPDDKLKEFNVSVHDLNIDHIIACEVFRQYMNVFAAALPDVFDAEFLLLLDKLKTDDFMDLSTLERANLLIKGHDVLVNGTCFVKQCHDLLSEEKDIAAKECKKLTDEIKVETRKQTGNKSSILLKILVVIGYSSGLEKQLADFDVEVVYGGSERKRIAERAIIINSIKKVQTKTFELLNQIHDIESEMQVVSQLMDKLFNIEPLGYDRFHNRFWYFPDISDKIFVESGWACIPVHHQLAAPVSDADPVVNFAFVDDTAEHFRIDERLLYLLADGTYNFCDEDLSFPAVADNKWSYYAETDVPELLKALNPIGIREKNLANQIAQRPPPTKLARPLQEMVENASAFVKKYVIHVVEKLISNLYLSGSLPPKWRATVEAGDTAGLKNLILTVFNLILKPLLKEEILSATPRWDTTITATNNLSRIYFLFVVLDVSVKWNQRLGQVVCSKCNFSDRRQLCRCLTCLDICHDGRCAAFVDGVCDLCYELTNDLNNIDEMSNCKSGSSSRTNSCLGYLADEDDDDGSIKSRLCAQKSTSRDISLDSVKESSIVSPSYQPEDSEHSGSLSCYRSPRELLIESDTGHERVAVKQPQTSKNRWSNYDKPSRLHHPDTPKKVTEKYTLRELKVVNYHDP